MKGRAAWRLRHQLVLLAAVSLLPILVIGSWGIYTSVAQRQLEAKRSALVLSRALASALDTELDAAIATLRDMAESPLLQNGDLQSLHELGKEMVRVRPSWIGMLLIAPDGNVIFTTSQPFGSRAARVLDVDSLERVVASGLPSVGKIAVGPGKRAAFPVRVPVHVDGKLQYVLTVAISPERIQALVAQQKVPQAWIITVIDAAGQRVARSRDHASYLAHQLNPSQARFISGTEDTGLIETAEGEQMLAGFTRLRDHGWAVAVGRPVSEIRAELARGIVMQALAIAGALLIFSGVAFIISRRTVRAVGALQGQADRLGQAQPVAVVDTGIRELDDVAEALARAAGERERIERERLGLLDSLNGALARAEEAGKAKDRFLAVLGHELRNPLAPMVGALEVMERKGDAHCAQERAVMKRQLDHMKRLVDDLLDVSRIESGKLEMRQEPVEVNRMAERILAAARAAFPGRKIVAEAAVDEAWIIGDEARLSQAVGNLLSNALKFSPDGETRLRVWTDHAQVRITVEDDGEGMDAATLARVFEPFYQAPQPLARAHGGLGLGLAIVRTLVERHGGTVSARSEGRGKGCMFEIVLPAAPRSAVHADSGKQAAAQRRRGRLLVVDDNVDAAESLAEVLRLSGHDVETAHAPTAALQAVSARAPDIAILDIGLPEMDGFALARRMRDSLPGWKGALIALSGYGQEQDKEQARNAGFAIHFSKPADLDALLERIDALLAASGKP